MAAFTLLLVSAHAAAQQQELIRVPSSGWTAELVEDLRLGLEALPPAARAFPGGPLEVELHPEPAPLGLGGELHHPSFTGGLTRIHLYGFQADEDRRAAWRLDRLTSDERRRLWRRRAVVHAVIRRWDQRLRWSARPGWTQLNGWRSGRPLISYPWAFSRRQGMESAALDLATFAEELLVPAESISPGAVVADDQVRCRELSKSRFLDERLAGLDGSWRPQRSCPDFERWAAPERVSGIEVGFAAPSSAGAQSLFGHLFLTVIREGEASLASRQVLQLAALVAPLEPRGLSFVARGLTGGYRGIFVLTTMASVLHEALELEQRSIRRFPLALTPAQRLRVLERIWELERVGYVDYRFLDANCASMLRFLLAPALGDGAPEASVAPWETPGQVLEGLGPALGNFELDEATGERARRAAHERWALLSDVPSSARSPLEAVWLTLGRIDGASNRERAAAYAALGALGPAADPWRAGVLLASLRIERHALGLATVSRIRAERSAVILGWTGPSTDELIAARQARYEQRLTPRRIASDELGEWVALDALLRAAPRRPFEAIELAALEAEAAARETFDQVSAAVAALPEEALSAALENERVTATRALAEAGARAVPEGGYGHGYAGAGLSSSGAPVLRLEAAVLEEELGDQRRGGFGGRSQLQVLRAAVDLAAAPSAVVQRASLTVIAGRTVAPSGWGWGGGLEYRFAADAHQLAAQLEGLWAFAADERMANFALASAGLGVGLRLNPSASAVFLPRVGLGGRLQLPGSFGNALRLEGAYSPRILAGAQTRFEHGIAARAQLSIRLGAVDRFALSARVDLEGEWRPGSTPLGVATIGVGID